MVSPPPRRRATPRLRRVFARCLPPARRATCRRCRVCPHARYADAIRVFSVPVSAAIFAAFVCRAARLLRRHTRADGAAPRHAISAPYARRRFYACYVSSFFFFHHNACHDVTRHVYFFPRRRGASCCRMSLLRDCCCYHYAIRQRQPPALPSPPFSPARRFRFDI